MSGFFLSNRLIDSNLLERFRFVQADQPLPVDWSGVSAILVRPDEAYFWAPAFCLERKVGLCIHGRIRLDPQQWAKAAELPLSGGLAARFLLDAWLSGGESALLSRYNGAGAVVIWEVDSRQLHLWTDRLGVVPIYQPERTVTPWAIASHPDVLADWLSTQGVSPQLDMTSLAESLSTGAVSPPFSFYQEIRLLEPARHYVWKVTGNQVHSVQPVAYWQPAEIDQAMQDGAAVEGMAEAFKRACSRKPPGKTVLLLSGGADSRGLLFAHQNPSEIQCLTFCDSENSEVARAKEVARLAGASHEIMFRDPEHYARGAEQTVRITGGMGSIKDAHFAGFQSTLESHQPSSLVTGCYADYLYKGLAFNRVAYHFLGRELPLEKQGPYHPDFYQPHRQLSADFSEAITARNRQRFGVDAATLYQRSPERVADLRVRPLTREADSVGRLYLLGTQPWDPVMVDNDLLEFYGRLSPAMKINSRVFAPAVVSLLPEAGRSIPNNNPGQFPLGLPLWKQWLSGAAWLVNQALRRKFFPEKSRLSTASSWPNFSYFIANSQIIPQFWSNWTDAQTDALYHILGYHPAQKKFSAWVSDPDLFLRLLTLKLWLHQRGI